MSEHMSQPRIIVFGGGGEVAGMASAFRADTGATDDGTPYQALILTNTISPARPTDEILCFATYISVGHKLSVDMPITVELHVDDHTPLTHDVLLWASPGYELRRYEVGWNVPVIGSQGQRSAQAPRGYRIRVGVRFGVPTAIDDLLHLEGIECEAELKAEGIYPSTAY